MHSYSRFFRENVDSATSQDISHYSNYLSSSDKFVLQAHGNVAHPRSWVFTTEERTLLYMNTPYIEFMKAAFHTKNILIMGFNPNDFIFDYLLETAMLDHTTTGSKHFIILPNPSHSLITSLSKRGIGVIPYNPSDAGKHTEIQELLDDLLGFIPIDLPPPSAFIGEKIDPESLPSPEDIINFPIEEARTMLNKAILSFMPDDSSLTFEYVIKLEEFYTKYMRAIHDCWLLVPGTNYDHLHGYKVTRSVGSGAFGQVYEAINTNTGDRVAVKVLMNEVKSRRDYFTSFRRGVNSMRILTKHKVLGMVPLKMAYEIPACIFMDFVDGPTLYEAKERGWLSSLNRCLEALVQVGEIVHSAHDLEERVLHRDLKPTNVIMKDCFGPMDDINIVVLDFDLSWHKGALDVSVVHGARAQGYAAPEQTATGLRSGVSTRNTAVDVFGYGMLAFFLFCEEDPRPNEQNFKGFTHKISESIKSTFECDWICLPRYLALIIEKCTYDLQAKRMGFSEALAAFRSAFEITKLNTLPAENKLLVLEIACRIETEGTLKLSEFERKARIICLDTTKEIIVELTDTGKRICLCVNLSKTLGTGEQRSVAKYLDRAAEKSISKLRTFPFDSAYSKISLGRVEIIAEWFPPSYVGLKQIEELSNALCNARAGLIFE